MHGRSKPDQVADIPQITVSLEPEPQVGIIPLQHYSRDTPSESSTHFLASERGTELSVIAEGDESPERSHANILPLSAIASNQVGLPDIVPRFFHGAEECPSNEGDPKIVPTGHKSQEEGDPSPDARYSVPPLFNYIPLDSPLELQFSEARTGNHTAPLPPRTAINSPGDRERNAFTAPLPVVPVSSSIPIPHTTSVPLNDSSPKTLAHKGGTPGFPTLPAPSPLRKSMRVTQEALTGSVLPTPAPAAAPLGKRTSWLMKAREAKAMEGTSSLPGTSAAAISTTFPRVSTAVKRKSGEMLGALLPGPDWDKDQHKSKVARSAEIGIVPPISKETGKTGQRDFPPVQGKSATLSSVVAAVPVDHLESHAMDVDEQITLLNSAEEGFIDLFKRTVEGLGARAGKSMGKSLGGAAAAALAEARAAAEAKVAERNKVNSESSDSEVLCNDGVPEQEPIGTRAHSDDQFPCVPTPQAEEAGRRLSLSDLVPDTVQPNEPEFSTRTAQAMDVGSRINSCDESVSTTPPDSPPLKGNPGFVKPAGPVFNKPPPPVFMPPASKQPSIISDHPKGFSFNFPSSQFALPVPVPLGIPARLTSQSDGLLSLVQGTSQMSVQPSQSNSSDPMLDNHDGIPAWSTQGISYAIDPQPCNEQCATAVDDDDDDDSWPLEEKLAAAEPGWRPFDFSNVDKEDTWSSLPTESQGPTRSLKSEKNGDTVALSNDTDVEAEANNEEVEREQETVEISDVECSITEATELEEVAETGMASPGRVEVGNFDNFECFAIVSITRRLTPIIATRSEYKPNFDGFHCLFSSWLFQSSHQTCQQHAWRRQES